MTDSKKNDIIFIPTGSTIDSTRIIPTSGTYTVHASMYNIGLSDFQKEEVRQIIKEELLKQYNDFC